MGNLDIRIAGRYQLQRKIGTGGFGSVYLGRDTTTGEDVAIKLEHTSTDPSFLDDEVEIYELLTGGTGIPQIYAHELEDDCNAMIFELLGPSLEDLFNVCGREFPLKTLLMLADQLLYRLQHIHSKGILHRDLKPENCLMGRGRRGNVVYVTDMGLAVEQSTKQGSKGDGTESKLSLVGTARYASIRGHLGQVQHPADDLESLGYMLVYFLRGSLPWQGLPEEGTAREARILDMKRTTSHTTLCKDLPQEFAQYFDYVRGLEGDERPDYARLRKSLQGLFKREGFNYDHVYEWTVIKYMMAQRKRKRKR